MKSRKNEMNIIEFREMCRLRGYSSRRASHRFNKNEIARLNSIKKAIYGSQTRTPHTKEHQIKEIITEK